MSSTLNTLVVQSLRIAASFADKVCEIRAALPKATVANRDALVLALRPGVAKYYGIEHAVHGKTGKFVTDNDKLSMAARTSLSKLARAVAGPVANHTEPVKTRVTAVERASYLAFLNACGGDAKRMGAVIKACKA